MASLFHQELTDENCKHSNPSLSASIFLLRSTVCTAFVRAERRPAWTSGPPQLHGRLCLIRTLRREQLEPGLAELPPHHRRPSLDGQGRTRGVGDRQHCYTVV